MGNSSTGISSLFFFAFFFFLRRAESGRPAAVSFSVRDFLASCASPPSVPTLRSRHLDFLVVQPFLALQTSFSSILI